MKLTPLNSVLLTGGLLVASIGHAGMVNDSHGNVGYDTAAECDAAVQAGQARFYEPSTTMPTLRRKGEATVRTARLSDLGPQYKLGACDVGVGRQNGRNGVAKALVGKYVPYSPDMPINLYADNSGMAVRASMAKCDNRFSDVMPRAVPVPMAAPAPAPVAVAPAPAPVPAPVAEAPVAEPMVAPAPPAARMTPYVFGTLGQVYDSVIHLERNPAHSVGASDSQFGFQLGGGLQFNELLGAEVFYQGGKRLEYGAANGYVNVLGTRAFGARMTVGTNLTDSLRLFVKAGVAHVKHSNGDGTHWSQVAGPDYSESQTRPLVGFGVTFDLTDNLALRADADHVFKRRKNNVGWGNLNYFGLGLQYKF
ncbi:MAG: outer membrane beta-barrel protein [Hydrogenophaga sp.]|jgi:opacity protein-like surface antigen|nr:outer membrane beta-barrel protein [Hydrogenophaga sp.]MDP3326589.1 outer membrane beta-barrel protein [Hydrogenophaga sp.]